MYNSILPTTNDNEFKKSESISKNMIYGSSKAIYNLKTPPMLLNGILILLLTFHVQLILVSAPLNLDIALVTLVFLILELFLIYFVFRKNIGTSFSEKFVLCRNKLWLRILRNTIGEIIYNSSLFAVGIIVTYNTEINYSIEYIRTQWIVFGCVVFLTIIREVFYTSNCDVNDASNVDLSRFCKITGLYASDFKHQDYTHKYIYYNAYFYKYFYNENSMLVDVNNIVRDPITEYKYTKYVSLL